MRIFERNKWYLRRILVVGTHSVPWRAKHNPEKHWSASISFCSVFRCALSVRANAPTVDRSRCCRPTKAIFACAA